MTGKKPKFFRNSGEFRRWLEHNHASEKELLVGFFKKDSAKPSIAYPEARDQALCFLYSRSDSWYRRTATYWVMAAKREETWAKRLAELIADSDGGLRNKQLRRE